ncbi:MAG: hypothetical protein ACKOEI_08360 [Chthoniobacterales bacterium]
MPSWSRRTRRVAIGRKARARAEKFRWEAVLARYEEIFAEILSKKN